jgi:hypothetical protein
VGWEGRVIFAYSTAATLISEGGAMKMKFKLMTRKGHKQQLKELNVPLDSDLASGLKDTQQTRAEEDFEEIKQKILESERRQEEEEYQGGWVEPKAGAKATKKNYSASTIVLHTGSAHAEN